METDQIKLLEKLADEIHAEIAAGKVDRERAIATLSAAGIMTKKGNFTKRYSILGKAVKDYNKSLKEAK